MEETFTDIFDSTAKYLENMNAWSEKRRHANNSIRANILLLSIHVSYS